MYHVVVKEIKRNFWRIKRVEIANKLFRDFEPASAFASRYNIPGQYVVIFKDLTDHLKFRGTPRDDVDDEWEERLDRVDPEGKLDEVERANRAGKSYADEELPF